MEIHVEADRKLDEDTWLSVRCGSVRKQVQICCGRPLVFPHPANLLKVEVFKQVYTGFVVLKGSDDVYKLDFTTGDRPVSYELFVRVPAIAKENEQPESPSEGSTAVQQYLKKHRLFEFVQGALRLIFRERPENPFSDIYHHLTNGYGVSKAERCIHRNAIMSSSNPAKMQPPNDVGSAMEVRVMSQDQLPDDIVMSIRCGSVRRQSPVTSRTPLTFPTCSDGHLEVSIFRQVYADHVELEEGNARCRISFPCGTEHVVCDLVLRNTTSSPKASPTSPDLIVSSEEVITCARSYLERHEIFQFIQAALQSVLKERPEDPFLFMAEMLRHECGISGECGTSFRLEPFDFSMQPGAHVVDVADPDGQVACLVAAMMSDASGTPT